MVTGELKSKIDSLRNFKKEDAPIIAGWIRTEEKASVKERLLISWGKK